MKWLRDKDGNPLSKLPNLVLKNEVYSVPNVWIAADLMRGGDLIDRVLNLGGSIGTFVGTDVFTSGFKVEKPTTFNDLIKTIDANKGFIWGMVLFAHGTPSGGIYSSANMTGTSKSGYAGNAGTIIDSLKGNGFKIAKAYPSQCYSLYKGRVKRKTSVAAPDGSMQKAKDEREVNWEERWKEVAIYVHGYYGWNIAWAIDGGWF